MTAFLVVNHYYHSEKLNVLHKHIISSGKKQGIDIKIKTNEEMLFCDEKPDFVLFWDKDICLAKSLENKGIPVFNSAKSIELCDDKGKTYLALENIVKQPKTIIAPLSFYQCDYTNFVKSATDKLGLPVVFKECFGSFGEQVFLCNTVDDVMKHIGKNPFLLQEFISTSKGEDIRIEVVGNECVCAMKRTNKNDFRSNITNGGSGENYIPTDEEKRIAITACKTLGLTFGGVDILNDNSVCEVNSNAHIINIMNTTGIDVADKIFEEIKRNL